MHWTFTDGKEIIRADSCATCQLTTAGEHEESCPSKYSKFEINSGSKPEIRIFRIDENGA